MELVPNPESHAVSGAFSVKRAFSASSAFLGVLLMVFTAGATFAQDNGESGKPPVNINGSFEDSEPGVVTDLESVEGWFLELLSNGAAEFEIVEDPVQDGNHALKILISNAGSQAWHVQAVGNMIPVDPGATYEFSVWARAGAAGAQAAFTAGNYAFNEYGALRGNITLPVDGWQRYSFEFTISDNETEIRAPIHFGYAGNVGIPIYIDNLQIVEVQEAPSRRLPVTMAAAGGEVGEDFATITENEGAANEITFVRITNDGWDIGDPTDPDWPDIWSKPISAGHVIAYEVTFPFAGEYNLFLRARVGAGGSDDDSFYYPNGFGVKDVSDANDWLIANQLDVAGYSGDDDFVTNGGAAASGVWKWLNISQSTYQTEGITYTIDEDNAVRTFVIGGREAGFDIHKIAFGRSDLYFTVNALDNGLAGITELPDDPDPQPTRKPLADGQKKWLGNVYSPSQILDFEDYWNQVTPENAGKWGSVEGTRNVMNWGGLDAAYNLAKDNGLPFRFHVLVWGNQQPTWMKNLANNPEEQLAEIRQWFEAVAQRYPDIDYLEVVNEPLHDPPSDQPTDPGSGNYVNALGGDGETGWDWIITAFEMAREIFPPTTKLMINDYGILGSMQNAIRYREIIELLQERELIDGIGVQGHAFSTRGSADGMTNVLNYLAETGLPIQVTEMDVDGNPTQNDRLTQFISDQNQLTDMQRIFPALWEHPAVEGITFWGWRHGLWRQNQEAYLVRENGEERPALVWIREYIENYVTSIDNHKESLPARITLDQNYPNPFNPSTQIRYEISEPSHVNIDVYDVMGRHIRSLINEYASPGQYSVSFDAGSLASGVYLYRLQTGSVTLTRQMMLIK